MKSLIKGLTVQQPWAHLISMAATDPDRYKRIENRTWAPRSHVGHYLAIHAGKKIDASALGSIRDFAPDIWLPNKADLQLGAIVAVCRLERVIGDSLQAPEAQRRWLFGPKGWLLEDVRKIEPIPCVGAQGLWELPPDVLVQVRRAWAMAN